MVREACASRSLHSVRCLRRHRVSRNRPKLNSHPVSQVFAAINVPRPPLHFADGISGHRSFGRLLGLSADLTLIYWSLEGSVVPNPSRVPAYV
jgi:hypothetical protein